MKPALLASAIALTACFGTRPMEDFQVPVAKEGQADRWTGDACLAHWQCASRGYFCDIGWTGGACTRNCSGDAQCDFRGACIKTVEGPICVRPCVTAEDCGRDGYLCLTSTRGGYCYPQALAPPGAR